MVDVTSQISSRIIDVRPKWIIRFPRTRLDESLLGKLSRAKIQNRLKSGAYRDEKNEVSKATRQLGLKNRAPVNSGTESVIVQVLNEMPGRPDAEVSIERTFFKPGITSVGLFDVEQSPRTLIRFGFRVSMITFLDN